MRPVQESAGPPGAVRCGRAGFPGPRALRRGKGRPPGSGKGIAFAAGFFYAEREEKP